MGVAVAAGLADTSGLAEAVATPVELGITRGVPLAAGDGTLKLRTQPNPSMSGHFKPVGASARATIAVSGMAEGIELATGASGGLGPGEPFSGGMPTGPLAVPGKAVPLPKFP